MNQMQKNAEENDLRFVTSGVISRDVYTAATDAILKKGKFGKIMTAVYLLVLICMVVSVCYRLAFQTALCVFLLVVYSFLVVFVRNRNINLAVRRMQEVYGANSVECRTGFLDDFVYGENLTQEGISVTISYSDIKRVFDTHKYLIVLTKGFQYLVVFKDCLSEGDLNELKAFLKGKIG